MNRRNLQSPNCRTSDVPEASPSCTDPTGSDFTPGTYCGFTFHGNGTYTFEPGLYIIRGGGITVTGGVTLIGHGVTFYLTKDTGGNYNGISMHGNETASFSAPIDTTHGGIPGILFFHDRSLPTTADGSSFGGTSGEGYTGALYFPTTTLTYKGNPSLVTTQTIIVGWKLDFRGDTSIQNYTLLPGGRGSIKDFCSGQIAACVAIWAENRHSRRYR